MDTIQYLDLVWKKIEAMSDKDFIQLVEKCLKEQKSEGVKNE